MSEQQVLQEASSAWVDEARSLPVYFAQVREDPELDLELVRDSGERPRLAMIASGGCTAAFLAGSDRDPRAGHLLLVDANRAQLELSRLKLHLLGACDPTERLGLLGHAAFGKVAMPSDLRRDRLTSLAEAAGVDLPLLGPLDLLAELGPDYVGRYEILFRELQNRVAKDRSALERLLSAETMSQQTALVEGDSDVGDALESLDAAWREVMRLDRLVAVFGSEATANRRQEFFDHFIESTRVALREHLAREDAFLWQVVLGEYPSFGGSVEGAPWLSLPRAAPLASVEFSESRMRDALEDSGAQEFDIVHLSNILDWLTPEDAIATLEAARRALRPGGRVILRQLNSALDVRSLESGFAWDVDASERSRGRDRSFFYRAIHIGRVA